MPKQKCLDLIEKIGVEAAQWQIDNRHPEAVYYVDEWTDSFGGLHGYTSDKFYVGRDNPHNYYRLDDLEEALKWLVNPVKNVNAKL
jgi:hypothetical protein